MKSLSITILFLSLLLILSCEPLTPLQPLQQQSYHIPRFSVDPLSRSGIPNTAASSPLRKINFFRTNYPLFLLPMSLVKMAVAQEDSTQTIDCKTAMINFFENAPKRTGSVERLTGIELVEVFYREAIMYDCLARYKAHSEQIGVVQKVVDSIKPDGNGNESPVFRDTVVLTVKKVNHPEEDSLFISWTDDPKLKNVRGKTVAKILQDNTRFPDLYKEGQGTHTKARTDLNISKGLRSVSSMFKDVIKHRNDTKVYSKAIFIEVANSNGSVNEHFVGGRYGDTFNDKNTVVEVQASVKKGLGTSVFFIHISSCPGSTINLSQSSTANCRVTTREEYYNSRGRQINRTQAEAIGLKTNNSSLPKVDSFYGTETEESFFRSVF